MSPSSDEVVADILTWMPKEADGLLAVEIQALLG
jgi:hypothetical protein